VILTLDFRAPKLGRIRFVWLLYPAPARNAIGPHTRTSVPTSKSRPLPAESYPPEPNATAAVEPTRAGMVSVPKAPSRTARSVGFSRTCSAPVHSPLSFARASAAPSRSIAVATNLPIFTGTLLR